MKDKHSLYLIQYNCYRAYRYSKYNMCPKTQDRGAGFDADYLPFKYL